MIVYGDPQFRATPEAALQWLERRLQTLEPTDRDQLRALLIQVGQLEQAVVDGTTDPQARHSDGACEALTDVFAEAFLFDDLGNSTPGRLNSRALDAIRRAKAAIGSSDRGLLTFKVPEGFEFYALYPEQYLAAADAWLVEHPPARGQTAVVIGVRGIGTTLSALVAARLRSVGWTTVRMTVRPQGHPFDREVRFESFQIYFPRHKAGNPRRFSGGRSSFRSNQDCPGRRKGF